MGTGIANATAVGWGQQTPAMQTTARSAMGRAGSTGRRRKRRTKARRAAPRKRKTSSRRRTKARLVKGSRAAKAYMAKIRRKRKR